MTSSAPVAANLGALSFTQNHTPRHSKLVSLLASLKHIFNGMLHLFSGDFHGLVGRGSL